MKQAVVNGSVLLSFPGEADPRLEQNFFSWILQIIEIVRSSTFEIQPKLLISGILHTTP